MCPKARLPGWTKARLFKIRKKLQGNESLKGLGKKRKVRNGSIIFDRRWDKVTFFRAGKTMVRFAKEEEGPQKLTY